MHDTHRVCRLFQRTVLTLIGIGLTSTVFNTTQAALGQQQPWLKVILVYDSTLPGAVSDKQNFENTFQELVSIYNEQADGSPRPRNEQLLYDHAPTLVDLSIPENSSGPSIEPSELLTAIKTTVIQSPPGTALVFWFKGHGFVDQHGSHWLELGNGDKFCLTRDSIRSALLDRKCRLTLILTEACTLSRVRGQPLGHFATDRDQIRQLVGDLLVRPKGVVDISSSTYARVGETADQNTTAGLALPEHVVDEASWTLPQGGLFSKSFVDLLDAGKYEVVTLGKVADKSAPLTWDTFARVVVETTDNRFVAWRKEVLEYIQSSLVGTAAMGSLEQHLIARQLHQTPQVFSLP